MAYTTIDNPGEYFNTKIYAPDGSSSFAVTGVGFQPDWVWLRSRNYNEDHQLNDSVRGATKGLQSNSNRAETSQSNGLTAFGSDGFTVGNLSDYNYSGDSIVSWNWKAGTAFSNDASSTGVGSIDSAGSVSTDAGFSIIQFSGTGSLGTVAHGLGVAPSFIAFKRLDTTGNWVNYHKSIGATKYLRFDTNSAEITASDEFNDTEPTSTVFTVETDGAVNASGTNNIIAYCLAEVKGYSKFSSYIGNGNADGTFVYTGFKPAWLMIKGSGLVESWLMFDTKRNTYNGIDGQVLRADLDASEVSSSATKLEFLSNGFKWRSTDAGHNQSGSSYIYLAFAESPFVNSKGIPNNAR
jgi:hypothetical protein